LTKELSVKIDKLRSLNDQMAENMQSDAESWTKLVADVKKIKVWLGT